LAFVSKKLTPTARRWSVIECFSIFFSVKKLSYYLYGKKFTIRTDHYNLLWMERSEVSKIIRMRIYLQSFNFTLNHINNPESATVVFAMSHVYSVERDEDDEAVDRVLEEAEVKPGSVEEALRQVHNSRIGHHGALRTWKKLREVFPGNNSRWRWLKTLSRSVPCVKSIVMVWRSRLLLLCADWNRSLQGIIVVMTRFT
jgi:hypothetical protein